MIVAGIDALGRHVAADMAGRASGRGRVVPPEYPVAWFVERHLVPVGVEGDAMLGLVVDFNLRMVGPHMTFAAILWRARNIGLEAMARMAGVAGAFRAVGIQPSHAAIGPSVGIDHWFVVFTDAKNLSFVVAFEFDDAAGGSQ